MDLIELLLTKTKRLKSHKLTNSRGLLNPNKSNRSEDTRRRNNNLKFRAKNRKMHKNQREVAKEAVEVGQRSNTTTT